MSAVPSLMAEIEMTFLRNILIANLRNTRLFETGGNSCQVDSNNSLQNILSDENNRIIFNWPDPSSVCVLIAQVRRPLFKEITVREIPSFQELWRINSSPECLTIW
jgi:hypothetical protein